MKLTKSIIKEIKKQPNHKKFSYEVFYKVTYMDNTSQTYLLPSDEYTSVRDWFKDWSNNLNDRIHKEVHVVLLKNNNDDTSVMSYVLMKSVTDYEDGQTPQVF